MTDLDTILIAVHHRNVRRYKRLRYTLERPFMLRRIDEEEPALTVSCKNPRTHTRSRSQDHLTTRTYPGAEANDIVGRVGEPRQPRSKCHGF